jgi:hypothetical protein
LDSKDTEKEEELRRRPWESNAELGQLIPINEIQTVAEITKEVAKVDESAACMQEKDDATMEVDSCTSVGPVAVSDVIPVSSESATATPKEMPLYQCISLHTITLASITLSKEMRLYLSSYNVQLKGSSQRRDVCVRWNDSRFLLQIQQSSILSSRNEKNACDLPSGDQMQTVSRLISPMLTNAAIDELGVRDKQLCAEIRTRQVAEPLKEENGIVAKKPKEWIDVKRKPENDDVRSTATSTSRNDFPAERKEEENRGVQQPCWKYKSRHKLEVKNYKSRHKLEVKNYKSCHKPEVKKLRAQYRVVIGLNVVSIRTNSAHSRFGKLSYSLLAEHEGHCVGPGLAEPPSRDPTKACSQNTQAYA